MKILVVDDDKLNRHLLRHYLSVFKELIILEAQNGEEAIEIFKTDSPDLVFMDVMMPVMNGVIATNSIKAIQPDLPIIAVTAYLDKNLSNIDCFDMVLEKPIRIDKIKDVLNKYLQL